MARASIGMVRGGLCLTSDGLSMLTRVGICLEVVRGCLRLSDVSGGVGGWTCLTRRLADRSAELSGTGVSKESWSLFLLL